MKRLFVLTIFLAAFTLPAVVIQKFTAEAGGTEPEEFDISGATYYAVVDDTNTYSFSAGQDAEYGDRKYDNIEAALNDIPTTRTNIDVVNIIVDFQDTTIIDFGGTSGGSASKYVLVRCVNVGADTARNTSGVWSTSNFRHSGDGNSIYIRDEYVYFDGVQMEETSLGSRATITYWSGASYGRIENCYIRTTDNSNSDACVVIGGLVGIVVANNLLERRCTGATGSAITLDLAAAGVDIAVYNNTFIGDGGVAFDLRISPGTYDPFIKNNIIEGFTTAMQGTGNTDIDYNVIDNSTINITPQGNNNVTNATVVFEDAAGGDYRLDATDTDASGAGTDLSSDPEFAFDDDYFGTTRSAWDAGFHEK